MRISYVSWLHCNEGVCGGGGGSSGNLSGIQVAKIIVSKWPLTTLAKKIKLEQSKIPQVPSSASDTSDLVRCVPRP